MRGVLALLVPLAFAQLAPRAYKPLPLGSIAPGGWLLEQLITQSNGLSGALPTSTFPGADVVNSSRWLGGDGAADLGTTQWLPYWANGNVPAVELVRAARALHRLDAALALPTTVDAIVDYILDHANRTNGWLGPYANEPGDTNGHGLWDPLNTVRALLYAAQPADDARARAVLGKVIAHMSAEAALVATDPIVDWAAARWPSFAELCQALVDDWLPRFGDDPAVAPLGASATAALLLNASALFRTKALDWRGYYAETAAQPFPHGAVDAWNYVDHGVNNAEGALRWPAVAFRESGQSADRDALAGLVLAQLDAWQAQPAALFCADEVFCGREPYRGTETCAVVEALAALEHAFVTFGDGALMDRVERLAFNALPAALTADMWSHVYVQQANSVYAGDTPDGASRGCAGGCRGSDDDAPSDEDRHANFYGVSHFPCCIVNFAQGWPKFALHALVVAPGDGDASPQEVVVASLVPANATLADGATVRTDSDYPFSDTATVTVRATSSPITLGVRVPGWAVDALVDGAPALNGTIFRVACAAGATTAIAIELRPRLVLERGWGALGDGTAAAPRADSAVVTRGALVFALRPNETRRVTQTFDEYAPARPAAVDLELSTRDAWNFALVVDDGGGLAFNATSSSGWSRALGWDTDEYPFSVTARARLVRDWGFFEGTQLTTAPPPSPVACDGDACGPETEITLVPFGATNLRISVFPWTTPEKGVVPFALSDVQLAGSWLARQSANQEVLLSLNMSRWACHFTTTANLTSCGASNCVAAGAGPPCAPLPGEMGLGGYYGHYQGHWLSATAFLYNNTRNATVKAAADGAIATLARVMDAWAAKYPDRDGYLFPYDPLVFDQLLRGEGAQPYYSVPFYTLHKIMAGLLDQWTHAGSAQARDLVERMAAWVADATAFADDDDELWQTVLLTEWGGMNDVLFGLFAVTGDAAHLRTARRFDARCFTGPLAAGVDDLADQPFPHANFHLPEVVGSARAFEVTGNATDAAVVRNFYAALRANHSFATGGSSSGECWQRPRDLGAFLSPETQESCTTYNALKIARHRFVQAGDVAAADDYERMLLNGIIGNQKLDDDGGAAFIYMLPLGSGTGPVGGAVTKPWGDARDGFPCCWGSLSESFSKLSDSIYFRDDDGVYVNLFTSSSARFDGAAIAQDADSFLAMNGSARIAVRGTFALRVRVPSWLGVGAGSIAVGGETFGVKPGSYFELGVKPGDDVVVSYPPHLWASPLADEREEYNATMAFMFGPLVLAGVDVATDIFVPAGDANDPASFIRRTAALEFEARAADGSAMRMIPLRDVRDEAYAVYFHTSGTKPAQPEVVYCPEDDGRRGGHHQRQKGEGGYV